MVNPIVYLSVKRGQLIKKVTKLGTTNNNVVLSLETWLMLAVISDMAHIEFCFVNMLTKISISFKTEY